MTYQTHTAEISRQDGLWFVKWFRDGSFTANHQMFGNINGALRFCRERGMRVVVV